MPPQRPLRVVINGGTREMPEVLAAALRDTDRARLFGEATAGCVSPHDGIFSR
jgi:C-terminal processing protease CtpA/Prc